MTALFYKGILAKDLKTYATLISKYAAEGVVKPETGMQLLSFGVIDPAHVAAIVGGIALTCEVCEGEENVEFGISWGKLAKYAGKFKGSTSLELRFSHGKLYLSDGTLEIAMALLEPSNLPKMPDLKLSYQAEVKMPFEEFKKAVKAVKTVSDTLVIEVTKDEIRISGGELEEDYIELRMADDGEAVDIKLNDGTEHVGAQYPVSYIEPILPLQADSFTVKLGTDMPMELSILPPTRKVGDHVYDDIIKLLVAPRVDNVD